jgi:hypothetical protein
MDSPLSNKRLLKYSQPTPKSPKAGGYSQTPRPDYIGAPHFSASTMLIYQDN